MNKRLLVALLMTVYSGTYAEAKADKPNILFILADDQTWEGIGAIGGEVKTPNLDKLMQGGVSFQRAYNMGSWSGAVCVASRHMFNTGRYVWNCNALINQEKQWTKANEEKAFPDLGKSWSQLLGDAGYRTYFAGKWHVKLFNPKAIFDVVGTVRPGMPKQTKEGYNRPVDENDNTWQPWDESKGGYWEGGTHWSEVLRDEAIGFIDQAAQEDDPFFMYIAFNAPHDPRQAPKEYVELYPVDSIKVPENFQPDYPYADEIGCGQKLRDERLAPFPRTEYSIKVNRAEYYALITHMDEQIGQILKALEKSGKLDNTYIFYTADHGLANGHHGLMGKQNMYEHSLGAPLIVNGPGLEKGKRITERVYIQDIVPSTLELAGMEQPESMDFESLLPLIKGERIKGREVIYGAYQKTQRCAMKGDWKIIHYPEAAKYRLYHVMKDPNEMNDLAENPEYAAQLKTMQQLLSEEMKLLNDPLL